MKIAIFGGSTTHGKGDPKNGGWGNLLRQHYEGKNQRDTVFVLGIPGETTEGLKRRIKQECEAREISGKDIILIAAGTNDSREDKDGYKEIDEKTYRKNLSEIIEKAKEFTRNIIIVGPSKVDEDKTRPFKGLFYYNKSLHKYNEYMKELCQKINTPFINNISHNPSLSDGLHPDKKEHKLRYEKIKNSIERILDTPKT